MNRFFPLIGALLFAGLFAGLSAISNHYCGDLTVGDALDIEPPARRVHHRLLTKLADASHSCNCGELIGQLADEVERLKKLLEEPEP
jgi:hypothetical protein